MKKKIHLSVISLLFVMLAWVLNSCGYVHEFAPITSVVPKFNLACLLLNHSYSEGTCTLCAHEDPTYVEKYDEATRLIESGDYIDAQEIFEELGDFRDSKSQLEYFKHVPIKIQYDSRLWQGGAGRFSIEVVYNEKNLPCQQILTSPDGDRAIDIYTYDSQEKLIQNVHTFYDGDKYTDEYTYDENGNLIKEVSVWYDGDKYIHEYTYNASGVLIKQVYTDPDGDNIIRRYIYDSNGKLIEEISTDYYDTEYIYDATGNLIKQINSRPGDRKIIQDYIYDANGHLVKQILTSADGDKNIYDYTYDESGKIIKEVFTESDGTRKSADIEYRLVYIPYDLTSKAAELLNPANYYDLRW